MPWDFALIFAVLGVVVPWRGAVRIKQLLRQPQLTTADRLALYASTIAFQWVAVGVTAWRSSARGLTAQRLGLTFSQPELTIATALALAVLLSISQVFALRRLARAPADRHGFIYQMAQKLMPHNLIEGLAFVALVITVALCEEFLYRGFVFAALQSVTPRSVLFPALGSSLMFALAHIYQGRWGLVTTFAVGMIFAGTRILTGNLAASIVAHLATDLVAGLMAPRLVPARQPEEKEETEMPTPRASPRSGDCV